MSKQWSSPAKLNLFLYVTGRRKDGYHNLQTLFQFVDLCDYLTFTPRADNLIKLQTEFNDVIADQNLIIKAARLLEQTRKPTAPYGIDIAVTKKIPMGGGLGGGSSNAATTLVALNQLWNTQFSKQQLMNIGLKLGADVPIFIFGHSAFAESIGENLKQVDIPEKWYLIVKPDIEIATVSIFQHPKLKRDTITKDLNTLLNQPFLNDCEKTVRQLYPQIDNLIRILSEKKTTRLTGTGSCIFSECETQTQAIELQNFLNNNHFSRIKTFIAKGCNRSPLYQ